MYNQTPGLIREIFQHSEFNFIVEEETCLQLNPELNSFVNIHKHGIYQNVVYQEASCSMQNNFILLTFLFRSNTKQHLFVIIQFPESFNLEKSYFINGTAA